MNVLFRVYSFVFVLQDEKLAQYLLSILNLTVTRNNLIKFLFVILTSTYINKFSSVFKVSVPLFFRNLIGGAFPLRKRFHGYFFSNGNSI